MSDIKKRLNIAQIEEYITPHLHADIAAMLEIYSADRDYIGPSTAKWAQLFAIRKAMRYACGIDLNLAGWLHDGLYAKGGTTLDKDHADILFYRVMIRLIKDSGANWFRRRWAYRKAGIMLAAVILHGEQHFKFADGNQAGAH